MLRGIRTLAILALAILTTLPALAAPEPAGVFGLLWERYDRPVAEGRTGRSWTWGPLPITEPVAEVFSGASGGFRTVQYYDKGRMEINDPNGDSNSPWFVTSGLLPYELMTGRRQVGFSEFDRWQESYLAAIGDFGSFPAYPDLLGLYEQPGRLDERELGQPVTDLLNPNLSITSFGDYASDPATVLVRGENSQGVPQAFVDFQNQQGVIYRSGRTTRAQVYDPLFIFGLPITPPVWVRATVGGVDRPVLFQVFERRILTYSPTNPPAFRVEMGNVGQHYQGWISDPGGALEFRPRNDVVREVRVGGQGVYTLEADLLEPNPGPGIPRRLINYRIFFSADNGATRELRASGQVGTCANVNVSLLEVLNNRGLESRIGLATQCADNPSAGRGFGVTIASSYDGGRTFVTRGNY